MRKSIFVAMAVAMVCLAGCNSGSESGSGDGKLTIAVVPKQTGGEFWETVESGARDAADKLGVEVKWEGTLTETEIAEQNRIIENMVNLGVDGMAIAPLNAKATRKSVEGAVDAGIPVVVFDSGIDGESHVSFVATNNKQGGALGAQKLIELIGDDKQANVLVIRFLQGTGSTEARVTGFIETAEAAGFNVVGDPYTEDGTVAGAKKTAANTLEGLIDGNALKLDGIFACNLYSALGMAAALDDLRKSGIEVNARFVGFDTSPDLIKGLQEGTIDALVAQNPKHMGYLAVETMVKHLNGEAIDPVIDTGVEIVTQERLENEEEIRKLVGME